MDLQAKGWADIHPDRQTLFQGRRDALVRGRIGGKERTIMEHVHWKERKMSNKHHRSVCYGRDTHPGSNRNFGPLRTVFHGQTDGQTEGWTDKPYYRDARRSLRIIVHSLILGPPGLSCDYYDFYGWLWYPSLCWKQPKKPQKNPRGRFWKNRFFLFLMM